MHNCTFVCDARCQMCNNWKRGNRKEDRDHGPVTITRYVCDRCGTAWEYENDKSNQKAGWSVVGR